MEYATGAAYEGQWKEDKANGQGTLTYSNGDKYEGWKIDKANTFFPLSYLIQSSLKFSNLKK